MLVSLVLILGASHGNTRITGELFRNHLDFFFFFLFSYCRDDNVIRWNLNLESVEAQGTCLHLVLSIV